MSSLRPFAARSGTALLASLLATAAWPAAAQTAQPGQSPDQPVGVGQKPGPAQDANGAVTTPPATDPSLPATGPYPAGVGGTPPAQAAEPATTEQALANNATEVVVTGYRQSLQSSTNAKRNSTGFTDSIFAEDIGKFPDTNIAETFNRIPGITIVRDITGEGVNVAIRGLGVNFTRVLLNNAPVAIASTGRTDSANANREVDLDLFPIELFTQLTVSKTPQADMVEGGVAGTVNMRSARPFDNKGDHLTYSIQGQDNTVSGKLGYRGSLLASHTGDNWGVLVGASVQRLEVRTRGFETIGYTNPTLSAAQCGAGNTCNSAYGGNGFSIPATVPVNAGNGLTTGTVIDNAFLLAQNPGATIQQIDNGLIPRLGRPSDEFGRKDRYNFIASAEYRPTDTLHFYVDGMYGRKKNDLQRIDIDWVGRNGAAIPLNTSYDRTDCSTGCVVTKGTYANSQFFLEYRPYIEDTEFYGVNPGGEWTITDHLKANLQANYTHSTFERQSPTVLVNTPASSGVTVNYVNDGTTPSITTNADLNNPANFVWTGGRVNLQAERRQTTTKGVRGDLTWGDQRLSLKVGGSYDDISRRIVAIDNTQAWQNATCGNNPSVTLPAPNTQPACNGLNAPGTQAQTAGLGLPAYAGYGQGYSAGFAPLVYRGSLIPQSSLASYLRPGPSGFVTLDFDRFRRDSQYDAFLANAPQVGSANTGASGGFIREKTPAVFAEVNGNLPIGDNQLNFDAGVRYVHTSQSITGLVSVTDPRNSTRSASGCPGTGNVADGSCYPNTLNFVSRDSSYNNWLPSVSAAFHIGDSTVLRGSVSRTLTRPDPSALLPGANFSSPSADTATIGNPNLTPYLATNFDVGFEYYTGKEGYFGVAAFRKSITGFTTTALTNTTFSSLAQYGITYGSLTPTQQLAICNRAGRATVATCSEADANAQTISISQQVNASGVLRVNGLEFNWVQPLDFLTERYLGVKGFGFSANVTLVDQKGSGQGAPAIALGVSPITYNVTAYYEGHGFTLRASTVYNAGSQTANVNQNGIPTAALFSNDYQQYDLSSSLDLDTVLGTKGLPQITFNVLNITNAEQRSYFQFENAAFTSYKPGVTFLFGIRGKL